MNYLGGKMRQGKIIAPLINSFMELKFNKNYYEPFCGSLGVAHRITNEATMVLSDIDESLICMWSTLCGDLSIELPDKITYDDYLRLKEKNDPSDWMTAYVGYGMSFGGKKWGGYARNSRDTDYASNLKRSVNLKRKTKAQFVCTDYRDVSIIPGSTVYLDPPYKGRTKQSKQISSFDHDEFWGFAEKLSTFCDVFVTEFVVPDSWDVVHNFGDTVVRHHSTKTKGDGTQELLVYKGIGTK